MMHRLLALRNAQREARLRQESHSPARPILTGTARKGYTPSDVEGLETVSVQVQNPNGTFPTLTGYDDLPSYP